MSGPCRAVILAAGEGSRLRPHTDDRPKCLVELAGRTLLDHQLAALAAAGVGPVEVVAGYRAERLVERGLPVVVNPDWATTNMVASLMAAEETLCSGADVLVCYGDLVYEPRLVEALAGCHEALATAVDLDWLELWRLRMEDPLADAETLRLAPDGAILEIGGRPRDLQEIQGQYLGLIRLGGSMGAELVRFFRGLAPGETVRGRPPARMYMTDLLQALVDAGHRLAAVEVRGGWLEVDTTADLETYRRMHADGSLSARWRPVPEGG